MMNSRHLPIATILLIALNLLVFAFGFITNSSTWIITNFGFIPDSIFNRNSADSFRQTYTFQADPTGLENETTANLIRLLSSMFIHASIIHIIFNMAALGYIGSYAEKSIGTGRYVAIYFLSGIGAALFHGALASYILGSGQTLLIGASGAISGVLGIAAAIGNRRAYYWLIIQVAFAFLGSVTSIPIAFTAHIGGFLAGVILTKLMVDRGLFQRRDVSSRDFSI
jgi:membrane associated rhomboid family serine protease